MRSSNEKQVQEAYGEDWAGRGGDPQEVFEDFVFFWYLVFFVFWIQVLRDREGDGSQGQQGGEDDEQEDVGGETEAKDHPAGEYWQSEIGNPGKNHHQMKTKRRH